MAVVAVADATGDVPLPEPAAAGVAGEAPLLAPEVAGEAPLLALEVAPDVAEPAAYIAW